MDKKKTLPHKPTLSALVRSEKCDFRISTRNYFHIRFICAALFCTFHIQRVDFIIIIVILFLLFFRVGATLLIRRYVFSVSIE